MKQFDCLDPSTPLTGHHFLEASAGTGKTFAIQHIVTRLLLEDVPLKDILIVTFTRAATRELKARLRKALADATTLPSIPYMQNHKDPQTAQFRLKRALANIDEAQVFTLHGFCHRMLSEYAFEAKLGFELTSEEETTYRDLLKKQITDFFRTSLTPQAFSPAQLAALLKNDPQKLIKKILNLIDKDGEFPHYPDFSTSFAAFKDAHATCPSITVDDYLDIAPFFNKLNFSIYTDQIQALSKTPTQKAFDALLYYKDNVLTFLSEENRNKRKKEPLPTKTNRFFDMRSKLLPIIEEAKNSLHTLSRIAHTCRHETRTLLNLHQVCSPDDILKKMHESLNKPAFLTRVRRRYQGAIIDEFQDTDPLQWAIFKRLFIDQPIQTLYLVGDPKQSIYSFRNADIYSYLTAANLIQSKAHLNTNYRSEPQLLALLNQLFSQNPDWLSLDDAPMPYRSVQVPPTSKDTPFNDQKSPLHFFILEKEKTRERSWPTPEIESTTFFPFIVKEIHSLTQNGFRYQDIAILVKDRFQASHLKTYLAKQNIPVLSKGADLLTETPLYDFFYALLTCLSNPSDTAAIKAFLAHPFLPYSHQNLKDSSCITEAKSTFTHFSHLFQSHGLQCMLAALLHHPWKEEKTLEALLIEQGTLEAYSDLQKFLELLLEHAAQTRPSLSHLLHYLESLKTQDEEHPHLKRRLITDSNAVSLMTIHMSKGLEFPIVFTLGLIKRHSTPTQLIHHKQKWLPFHPDHPTCQCALQNQEAEKLRQLYVALTRAKTRLYVPALIDLSDKQPKLGEASPLELFLSKIPSLKQTLQNIGATYTQLEEQTLPLPKDSTPPQLKKPHPFTLSHPKREMQSFSSLAAPRHTPIDFAITDPIPKGPETGLLIHLLLETLIQERLTHPYQTEKVHDHIQHALTSTILEPWIQEITHLIDKAFHLPLTNFSLKDVVPTHLHTEVEFLYLSTPHYIKGFADLIFFHQNHYYILDWKTNLLSDYSPTSLQEAMHEHDYFLQSQIYSQALERYLIQKKAPHTFLGTFYVFLRGLSKDQGILFLPRK